VTDELTPRAVERLLDAAEPLREGPGMGLVDEERYELREEIGRGGMGVVFSAWDRELERPVAFKFLSRAGGFSVEGRARFLREARAAARLAHPHIGSVFDATPDVITMQLIEGSTLADSGIQEPREIASLMRDAALAIHYAHDQGVIHRDLKPSNLMVTPADSGGRGAHIYVMDFGLAKERTPDAAALTTSIVGTPGYMAPEQAQGQSGLIGPQTDVYGLGATLYWCLSGHAPIEDSDVYRGVRRVIEEDPAPLRTLAPQLDRDVGRIVEKCLQKDPGQRYASALALASDLDRWLRGEPIQARPSSLVYRLRRFVSRRQGAIVASLAAATLAALVILPFVVQARAEQRLARAEEARLSEVFALSLKVSEALRNARATRATAGGYEQITFAILEESILECRAFLAKAPAGEAHFFLGQLLREQGRADEAVRAFDRAQAMQPGIPHLHRERGLAIATLYRDQVPVLGEAPPVELETWRARGLADLETALGGEVAAPTLDLVFARGHLAWLRGDLNQAIERLREVVELEGTHLEAHLSLSRLYLLVGRDDLAVRHSVGATDLLRGFRPAYVARANLGSAGPVSVEASAEAGSRLDPILVHEPLELEGLPELLFDFSQLLQLEPTDAHTFGLRGQVQARSAVRAHKSGALDQCVWSLESAIQEFNATLELQPGHIGAQVNRGACRALLGRTLAATGSKVGIPEALSGAFDDYSSALRTNPDLRIAAYNRALLEQYRAQLARIALDGPRAQAAWGRAQEDAQRAAMGAGDQPWQKRYTALADSLGISD